MSEIKLEIFQDLVWSGIITLDEAKDLASLIISCIGAESLQEINSFEELCSCMRKGIDDCYKADEEQYGQDNLFDAYASEDRFGWAGQWTAGRTINVEAGPDGMIVASICLGYNDPRELNESTLFEGFGSIGLEYAIIQERLEGCYKSAIADLNYIETELALANAEIKRLSGPLNKGRKEAPKKKAPAKKRRNGRVCK